MNATLEEILASEGYYPTVALFDVVNIRALDENSHPIKILSHATEKEVVKFLISKTDFYSFAHFGSFGDAVEEVGFSVTPVVYEVYCCKEVSYPKVTGTISKIWDWVKSNGLLERYVERTNPHP